MATASTSGSDKNHNKDNNFVSSTYHKAVCLQDWWLIRTGKDVDGRRLAVEGLTLRGKQQAMRVFTSAPIMKRHDMFTLETVDGITVLLKGTVNKSRSLENGFPSEVCSHFLLGFPYYWGTYADQCDRNESTTTGLSRSMPAFDECLDGQAVIKTLNQLISTLEVSGDSKLTKIFDTDVLEKCRGDNLETPKMRVPAEPLCFGPLSTNKEAKKMANEQENLNKDGDSDPYSVGPEITYFQEKSKGVIAIPNIELKTEVFSSGIKPLTTQETSIGNDITAVGMHISHSKRITSNCLTDTLGNYNCEALEDHMVPTMSYEDTAFPAITKGVPAESPSVGITKLSNNVEKSRNKQNTVKAICGMKNESANFCLSEPQDYKADMEPPVEETDRAGAISSLSDETLDGAAGNCSLSTTAELHKTLSMFGKNKNSIVKDETLLKEPLCLTERQDVIPKDFSISVGSDVNGASLTEVHKVILDDPETLSRLESSNCSMKYKRKTKLNLKCERSRDLRSCTYNTVKKDFIGHTSSSICPDRKNIPHSEIKMAGSLERTKSSSTMKHTNLHSISKSQDCEAVKGTLVKEKLEKGLSVGFEGTLKDGEGNVGKSVSAESHVGSPKLSERGENRNCDTLTEPTVKLKLESNGICSLQVGTDILNSTPSKSAATGSRNWVKNLKVSGKNSSSAVGSESDEPISTYEVLKKSNGEHLIGKIDFSEITPPCRKMHNSKKTVKPSEATRSSSRLKNLRDRCKDQTSCSRLVNANKGNTDPELGGLSTLAETNVGRQKITHVLKNESVSSDAVGNITDCAESHEQNESRNSLKRLGDLRNTSKMSKEHGESNDKGVGISGSKRKRKQVDSHVSLPPLTRKRKKESPYMSPECVSHGRSRSGRLLLRPLDFWRNEHIVYNLDGEVAGVQEGMSPIGSSSGYKPESLKTKRKQV